MLASLIEGGFSLAEACRFIHQVKRFPQTSGQIIGKMNSGEEFSQALKSCGFQKSIVIQLEFSHIHGDLKGALRNISDSLSAMEKQKQKLKKIALYPMILLIFLFATLFFLRQFLLPQLKDQLNANDEWYFVLLEELPAITLVATMLIFLISLTFWLLSKRISQIKKHSILAKIPFFKGFLKDYLSFTLAQEWGNLFKQGLEIKEVSLLMSQLETSGLMKEIGLKMQEDTLKGISLEEQVKSWDFIHEELSVIIFSGDAKGKLGDELSFYARLCWQEMIYRMEKAMQLIQPLVFLFIALVILGVYAAIMLPLYSSMGDVFQ